MTGHLRGQLATVAGLILGRTFVPTKASVFKIAVGSECDPQSLKVPQKFLSFLLLLLLLLSG